MNRAFRLALVVGAFWGFVEVVFTYVVGIAPTTDVFEVFLAPLIVSVVYHLFFSSAWSARPIRVFDTLTTAGLLLPAVIFLIRGRERLGPMDLLSGLVPLALCLVFVVRETKTPTEEGWATAWRAFSILVLYLATGLAYVVRGDRLGAITETMILTSALYCGVMAMVAAGIVALTRRYGTSALFVALAAASLAIAWQRGSHPPSYTAKVDARPLSPSGKEPTPNVLLVILDTVRVDHLDLYGYSRPTFVKTSAYLQDALIFDRATSTGSFSLPSHGSLFTGLLPSTHGAHTVLGGAASYSKLWPDIATMASFLRDRGYRTAGVSGNDVFLAPWTGLQKGFDTFFSSGIRSLRFIPVASQIRRLLSRAGFLKRRPGANQWSAAQVTDAAIDLVSDPRVPFFVFLNYFDAHEPHVLAGSPPWVPQSPARPIDAYDSEIASIDTELARLLGVLKQRGQLDQTLLIVAADHGEYFGERRLRGHPPASYEPGIHVPLMMRLPGVLSAGRSGRRTGLHEVFRVVQDVLNRNSLDWLREIDLTPRILNEVWASKDYDKALPKDGRPSTTVVFEGNLKLIHRLSGELELFDLDSDPNEIINLIDSTDPRLSAARERMIKEVMLRKVRAPGPAQPLSEDVKERLRALGYIK